MSASADLAALGIDGARLRRAIDSAKEWVDSGQVPAISFAVGRRGRFSDAVTFGVKSESLFLMASPTKPVTATAIMILVERGQLALEDRAVEYLPRLAAGKREIRIRHLLTHTSGLPDMPPDNLMLRRAHRPLSAFVESTYKVPLLFEPGTRVNYQSMGSALLGEIVHQITGKTLPDFLQSEVFGPLSMRETSLGFRPATKDRIAPIRLPDEQRGADWSWNSDYWLGLGVPWGGLVSNATDYLKFITMTASGGVLDGVKILSRATARVMTINQLSFMPRIPEDDRQSRGWGLGWRLGWPAHPDRFGDLLSPRTFGHWGATGTLVWADPETETSTVILSTLPHDAGGGRFLVRLSNLICAALN